MCRRDRWTCYARSSIALRIAWKLPDDNTLVARPLCKLQGALYASPDYLARRGMPATPQALERHACLQFLVCDSEVAPWQLERGKEVWHHTPTGPTSANSMAMIHLAALQGLGIAPLHHDLATGPVTQGPLVRVLPEWTPLAPTVWAVMLAAALQEPCAESAEALP
jgi:DNA-binding transcriptional LysR family regulator